MAEHFVEKRAEVDKLFNGCTEEEGIEKERGDREKNLEKRQRKM